MSKRIDVGGPLVSLAEAADVLGMPVSGVEALIRAGYLTELDDGLARDDVEAFELRNSSAAGGRRSGDRAPTDPLEALVAAIDDVDAIAEEILDLLEASIDDLSRRAADVLSSTFSETANWTEEDRDGFREQTADRFRAILTVVRAGGNEADLLAELRRIGASAAEAGAVLPHLLATLRVSRDLLVQGSVVAAEETGRPWTLALAVVLTRVLPLLDRLADSLGAGYWHALLQREQEATARYAHVVEHSSSGVYEVDLDGRLRYVNPAMAELCRRPIDDLLGRPLGEILRPIEWIDLREGVFGERSDGFRTPTVDEWSRVVVRDLDGRDRRLALQVTCRTVDGRPVGFDGVVLDATTR